MRVLVCGDRNWSDYELVLEKLREVCETVIAEKLKHHYGMIDPVDFRKDILVIDGEAPGADSKGHKAASSLGCRTKRFTADWAKYGKAAGPIRNQQMLDEGKPDLALAFHDDLKNSKGTKDMIKRAEKAGVKVVKIHH